MIEDTFLKLKSNLELTETFSGTISRQHSAVRSAIENNNVFIKGRRLIGSVGRHTRIQPRPGDEFDIDILVVIGEFYNWVATGGINTSMAMEQVFGAVQSSDRYAKMNPEQDHPTISFSYANTVKVELVPAYFDRIGKMPDGTAYQSAGRAYWIPARSGQWELADYDYEAERITAINQSCSGMFIPTVKMLKAVKRVHFPLMKSYLLEVIAADIVPKIFADITARGSTPTYPLLVASALYQLKDNVFGARGIPGSLSPTLSLDVGAALQFNALADWLQKQASDAWVATTDGDKHAIWRTLFGEVLPLP